MRCDCHVHVIGPAEAYPQVSNRTYLATPAPLSELQRLGKASGVGRFVVVQPSFYGTDNSVLLEALAALGDNGRGVAVLDPARAGGDTLGALAAGGVRGLRINLYSPLGDTRSLTENFVALTRLAQPMNWHIEVIASLPVLAIAADVLAGAPVTVVLDHYGLHGDLRPDSIEARRLLRLLSEPHVWMKLSAPYRSTEDPLTIKPDREWLSAIVEVAGNRCVWGSDWPFTPPHEAHKGGDIPIPHRKIEYRHVVDAFLAAIGDAALAEQIMTSNPERLYGF